MSSSIVISPEEIRKREFWEPCRSKEELYLHIKTFLNIDLPRHTIDEFSTSNPLDFIWSIYEVMLTNKGAMRHVVACSRNAMKCHAEGTLVATPSGPRPIEALNIGDVVYDEYGKPIKVIGVWDQGEQECVNLMSGKKVLATCTIKHPWLTIGRKDTEKVKRVEEFASEDRIVRRDLQSGDVDSVFVEAVPCGKKHCWDITVDSETSLYCLQNGLITHNTLGSAIIHFYGLIHFRRDCCQMAAIKSQSGACIKYIDKFLMIPEVAGYSNINNQQEKILTNLPANSFTDKKEAKLLVIVATLKGTNSARASCFAGKTEITVIKKTKRKKGTSSYRMLTIDGLYKRVMRGEVWEAVSVNPKTLQLEQKPIIAATRRINLDRLVFTMKSGKQVECTTEHPLAVSYDGHIVYEKAGNLKVGDHIITKRTGSANTVDPDFYKLTSLIDTTQPFCPELFSEEDLIEGTLLGDGCVFRRKNKFKEYAGNATLTITKEMKAKHWLEFFVKKLQEFGYTARINDSVYSGYTGKQQLQLQTGMSSKLLEYRLRWYDENGKKRIPADLKLTWGKLAVLLMDDSHAFRVLSTESFSLEENDLLAKKINELTEYDCAVVLPYVRNDQNYVHMNLRWPKEHGDKYELLLKYIHDCYKYKDERHTRLCIHCGKVFAFSTTENVCNSPVCRVKKYAKTVLLDEIVSIENKTANPTKRERWVYDIEVQDNHNFFANGVLAHNCLISDEVELIEPDILSEAANIADPTMREGFDPISIYLSSRKFSGGPLQGLIDEAESSVGTEGAEIQLHKWSLCDFMQRCPESLHQPTKARIKSLINRDTLEVIWGKEAEEADKTNCVEIDAYHGCRTCGAFIVCQTRATKQIGNSPSLRTPKFVAGRIRDVKDPKKVIAQILNWKPESTGLVYPMFTPPLHLKSAVEAYKWISGGIPFNPMGLSEEAYQKVLENEDSSDWKLVVPTKRDLYKLMCKNGWKIHWGVDWGYTDPASVVICGFDKKSLRALVLHAEMRTGHSNQDWAEYICTTYGKHFAPDLICPDMADGAAPTYFAKFKFQCRDTKPSRIETGVSFVRSLLWNVSTQTPNFCILDDRSNGCLVEEMQNWTHLRIPTGYDFDKFDPDEYTHTNDALRYLLDPFIEEAEVVLRAYQKKNMTMAELFENAKDTNDTDAQIALARKQMEDYFAREHGLSNVFNDKFRVPFAIPLAIPSQSVRMLQNHIDDNDEKRKGGFFYRF